MRKIVSAALAASALLGGLAAAPAMAQDWGYPPPPPRHDWGPPPPPPGYGYGYGGGDWQRHRYWEWRRHEEWRHHRDWCDWHGC
jgi:hypothetical protein